MNTYLQSTLPFNLQSALDEEIDSGEMLRWSCQPSVSRAVKKALPASFFGIIWLAFPLAFAWLMYNDIQKGKSVPIFAMAIVGVFFLIGLLILTTPIWATRTAKNTVYAITNRRAIIIAKKGAEIDIQSYRADKLEDINKKILSDGSGDLIFERQISYHTSKGRTRERVKEIGFFGIPAVNEVEDLLDIIKQQE